MIEFIIAQVLLDIWIVFRLIKREKDVTKTIHETIQNVKSVGVDPPRCENCHTIQYVSKWGSKYLCRMCASHVVS